MGNAKSELFLCLDTMQTRCMDVQRYILNIYT